MFYCTAVRNISRYKSRGAPVNDPVQFREWVGRQQSAPDGLLARLDELVGVERDGAGGTDWEEFEKQVRTADPNDAMAKIGKARDWAYFQFERASKTKKKRDEKFYSDLLAKMEGTLHDAQLRAKKLGIDSGDLVRRDELERPARFLGYHLLRCADAALGQLARQLTERDPSLPPLTVGEVRAMGEPLLLTALVFQPLVKAMEGDNGAAPPRWLVEAMKAGMEEVVE